MRLAVPILSDIHFEVDKGHPILGRAEAIASAVSSVATGVDALLLVLPGDIANSGEIAEFAVATVFLNQLKEKLTRRLPNAPITVVATPGNHDCTLPKDGEAHRKAQVDASRKTVLEPQPDEFFLRDLLHAQVNFWDFANSETEPPTTDLSSRLCRQYVFNVGPTSIQVNLINSALASQRKESRSELYLPVAALKSKLTLTSDIGLAISIVHHPSYWIEPTNMTGFRQLLNHTSDLVITGHQHFSTAFSQAHSTGEELSFYESPPLYDSTAPTSSAFRVILFDFESNQQQDVVFRWRDGIYRIKEDPSVVGWKPLVINRRPRYSFDFSAQHLHFLSDLGIAYVQAGFEGAKLSDLFVFPDIKIESTGGNNTLKSIPGDQSFANLTDCGVVVLQGGTFSGKTALAKELCLGFSTSTSKVPVFLEGQSLRDLDADGFRRELLREFKRQFRDADIDSFLQLPADQRAVIVDNWHLASLTDDQRSKIYRYLRDFTTTAVLITDEIFKFKQMVRSAPNLSVSEVETNIRQGEIVGLSYVMRGRLIEKWYRLRKNGGSAHSESSNAAKVSEDLISSLLGKENLPPYAFFVLCMLQAQESKQLENIAGGSFGHYHEVLVYTALTKGRSQSAPIDRKVAFCCEIAAFIWRKNTDMISSSEVDEVVESYLSRHYMQLQKDKILTDLQDARILSKSEDHFTFAYSHFYYYFVARYIKEHFDGEEGPSLRLAVDRMIDEISSTQNSTIIMFLIYFANDRQHIIERLLGNASRIYPDVPVARLDEEDAASFLKRKDYLPPPPVDEDPNIGENRHQQRVRADEMAAQESGQDANTFESYSYADDLSDSKKMHLAERNIEALGQVIRNFSATLPGRLKVSVLQATYTLGLRTMARILKEVATLLETKAQDLDSPEYSWQIAESGKTIRELRDEMEKMLLIMGKLISIHYCKKISTAVGVADNELAYQKALENMPSSVALRLIDVTIQMEHSSTFPESVVYEIYDSLPGNSFARSILLFLVAMHLLVYKVEATTRKRVSKRLNFDMKKLDDASARMRQGEPLRG